MSTFRGDSKSFPYTSGKANSIWFFIIDWKTKSRTQYTSVGEKRNMLALLKTAIESDDHSHIELYGVWSGEWSTDIFCLPIQEAIKNMEEVFADKRKKTIIS